MYTEFIIVWFPREGAYYRVAINGSTEEAVWRLEVNSDGYHEVVVKSDEAILWKQAQFIARRERPPGQEDVTTGISVILLLLVASISGETRWRESL
jgi:hypothetical protein